MWWRLARGPYWVAREVPAFRNSDSFVVVVPYAFVHTLVQRRPIAEDAAGVVSQTAECAEPIPFVALRKLVELVAVI